jgi:hypothetical protein
MPVDANEKQTSAVISRDGIIRGWGEKVELKLLKDLYEPENARG